MILPASVAGGAGLLLGTVGFFGASFGLGTMCTDWNETTDRCDALYHWLDAGVIGQWALVILIAMPLAVGLGRAARRRAMAISAWFFVPLAFAWYAAYLYGGYRSY